MQKLKKALKKLAKLGGGTASKAVPAKAAKKATLSKKKTQAVPSKKAGAAAAAKKKPTVAAKPVAAKAAKPGKAAVAAKAVVKKAAPAKAAPAKASAKDEKSKKPIEAAPAKGKAAAKVVVKAAAKPPEKAVPGKAAKAPEKAPDKAAEKSAADKSAEKAARGAAKARRVDAQNEALAASAAPQVDEDEEVILTDAEGRRYCRVKECDQLAVVDVYCRYHYLLFWKKIQVRKKILTEGKLERYIEDLTARYPDKYLEMLRKDLRNEKDFTAAIQELEIDDTAVDSEYEDEAQSYLEEVRGMSSETPTERTEDEY